MLASENWCVKVAEKIYGPYTSQQMRKYAHEGRVNSTSLVAPAGSRAWRQAREEAAFASFFGNELGAKKAASRARTFGRANTAEANGKIKADTSKPVGEVGVANFLLIFDVVSGAAGRVEAPIVSLGHAFRITDNVWSLTCELTAVGVRNAIAPYLHPRESFFVVDASRGQTSWQNFAPETQAKITASYNAGGVKKRAAMN